MVFTFERKSTDFLHSEASINRGCSLGRLGSLFLLPTGINDYLHLYHWAAHAGHHCWRDRDFLVKADVSIVPPKREKLCSQATFTAGQKKKLFFFCRILKALSTDALRARARLAEYSISNMTTPFQRTYQHESTIPSYLLSFLAFVELIGGGGKSQDYV